MSPHDTIFQFEFSQSIPKMTFLILSLLMSKCKRIKLMMIFALRTNNAGRLSDSKYYVDALLREMIHILK